jgi:thiamine biosynthesis lipoprotein
LTARRPTKSADAQRAEGERRPEPERERLASAKARLSWRPTKSADAQRAEGERRPEPERERLASAKARLSWALGVLAAALGCAGAAAPPHEIADGRYAMGTVLELTLVGGDDTALAGARDDAFAEVERLEGLLSTWRPESDASRLNAAAGRGAVAVDAEVAALLARCTDLAHTTRGSFDVTVGPLVSLWRESAARGELPDPAALAAARARVGPDRLSVSRTANGAAVALAPGSAVDLGGVAKGYAIDRVRERIGARADAALLSFGQSSTWAIGRPPGAAGWRLLARAPGGGFAGVLTLRDRALSVSESLGQWNEIAGRRYGHVLDPRTGQALTRSRAAFVVTDDAALAEALSKALLVLGPSEGIELIEKWPGAEALLLDADGEAWSTRGWQAATHFESIAPDPALKAAVGKSDP